MPNWASLFGDFDGRLWLNTADQGPLPLRAMAAAQRALECKVHPGRLTTTEYQAVPERLRAVLRSLIGAGSGTIVLGNSTTYGLSIIARALRWRRDDCVLLVEGDFPANFTPWRSAPPGTTVKFIADRDWAEDPARSLRASLKQGVRLFCTSWVDSFTGRIVDLYELGRICHANSTMFVVNVSQGLGNRLFSVSGLPIDALSCSGSKWLCGPYGTGFAWISDRLISEMSPVQYSWQANRTEAALMESSLALDVAYPTYDVFATANFLNYVPWTSAVECLLETGIGVIAKHIDEWVLAFREGLKTSPYEVSGGTGSPSVPTLMRQFSWS